MKNLLILLVVFGILGFGGYSTYNWAAPSITILNNSNLKVVSANVAMAKTVVSFPSIDINSQVSKNRGVRQVKSAYRYEFRFENGSVLTGTCGQVEANEYFVKFVIDITTPSSVNCSIIS